MAKSPPLTTTPEALKPSFHVALSKKVVLSRPSHLPISLSLLMGKQGPDSASVSNLEKQISHVL